MKFISIVIPVYNTEAFLKKCLESISEQTCKDFEVVIVNDKSPGNCNEIVDNYIKNNPELDIKLINNKDNLGLYHARIEGVKFAEAQFVTFLDSDDWYANDLIRRYKDEWIKNKEVDVIQCEFVESYETKMNYIPNNKSYARKETGEEIIENFFEQCGMKYSYHTVWNKCYSKNLWNASLNLLTGFKKHLIMTEDLLFSTILLSNAKYKININYIGVFYHQNEGASTALNKNDKGKAEKNLIDIVNVFNYLEDKLVPNLSSVNRERFKLWAELYSRFWYDNVMYISPSNKIRSDLLSILEKSNCLSAYKKTEDLDHSTYKLIETYDCLIENAIFKIKDDRIKLVSFDIFDTLITRKVYSPEDVFDIVQREGVKKNIIPNYFDFSSLRKNSESKLRSMLKKGKEEDVTIDEIYYEMSKNLNINLDALKFIEIQVEKNIVLCLEQGLTLLSSALENKKKVILTSDMYLPKSDVIEMLNLAGYSSYINDVDILISCELNKSKHFGSLYEEIIKIYNFDSHSIIHFGDNVYSDVKMAQKYNIKSYYLPNNKEVMEGKTKYYHGKMMDNLVKNFGFFCNGYEEFKYSYFRCALSVIKNNLFSYRTLSSEGSYVPGGFHGIGYAVLGPLLHGISQWLINISRNNRIILLGRDGFLMKEYFSEFYPELNVEYFEVSRKACISSILASKKPKERLLHLAKWDVFNPGKLFKALFPTLDVSKCKLLPKTKDRKFCSPEQMLNLFNVFVNDEFYKSVLDKQANDFVIYTDKFDIKSTDIFFDLGYEGTAISFINEITKNNIENVAFMHTVKDTAYMLFPNVHSYYQCNPHVSGAMREYFFSEPKGSIICYNKGKAVSEMMSYHEIVNQSNTKMLQKAALYFCREMLDYIKLTQPVNKPNYNSLSFFMEEFLTYHWEVHRDSFQFIKFEDDVSSERKVRSIIEDWPVVFSNKRYDSNLINEKNNISIDLSDRGFIERNIIRLFLSPSDVIYYLKKNFYKIKSSPKSAFILLCKKIKGE